MRPGVSHLGGCVTARGPAQGPPLILRLILGASPGVCSELFREEPHSPLLSWDRERCRRSWKIEVIVTEPLLWQEHSCEDSFILVMNKRWEVSCSGIGTSTPDSADDCVDRWQLSASVFLAEQLGKDTGAGGHFLLLGIFPTQGSNWCLLCLLHHWAILYHLRKLPRKPLPINT
ncbi:uncharacterized protein LOC123331130 isoform X6 [Bubalus bubalis]|uniref:uncharacterized protein LOC123331130 isoform X6 n=1 Tax=Bubalus bubalis TaxID=89462 RepID=UPI001E1B9668|nr:uncharacterized protein LOC123331130 isoform X6 [Bubalus bubalis]